MGDMANFLVLTWAFNYINNIYSFGNKHRFTPNGSSVIITKMNSLCVMKFGGSSLADFTAMTRCAAIVANTPDNKVVVVSAIANTTRLLVTLARADVSQAEKELCFQELNIKHQEILDNLADPGVSAELETLLAQVKKLAGLCKPDTPELKAALLSHGESMASLLFAAVLRSKNITAQNFDVRQVMRTDSNFAKAEPNIGQIKNLSKKLLLPLCKKQTIVTQGFIGSDAEGKTTLLGMEGSDYTAALLAEALQAEQFEIWKDVAGIYTIDPDIIPSAKPIPEISFYEAAELAKFGATVLHPLTLLPAIRGNIKFFVGSSLQGQYATLVKQPEENESKFRALSLRLNQILLTIKNNNNTPMRDFLAQLFKVFADAGIDLDVVVSNNLSTAVIIDDSREDLTQASLLTDELLAKLQTFSKVKIERDLALIAVVGNNINNKTSQDFIFNFLQDYDLRTMLYGISSHSISFLIAADVASRAVQELHQQLFEG